MIRFVVLAAPRTGSTQLVHALRQHPDIYMHSEVFHQLDERMEHEILPEALPHLATETRKEEPLAYAQAVLDFAPEGKRAVGFKMFRIQSRPASDWLMADTEIPKIVLERQNLLAMFASSRLARMTGVYNVGQYAKDQFLEGLRARQAEFVPEDFREFCDKQTRIYTQYKKKIKGPLLWVTYADLAAGRAADQAVEFLGLPPLPPIKSLVKLHGNDIAARFTDETRPLLEAELSRIDRPDWTVEDLT